MRQKLFAENFEDDGRPAGGYVRGTGLGVDWQNGPLALPNGERREPNGAFVEGVIEAAKQRLEYYQGTEFHCSENAVALSHLGHALDALDGRTARRTAQGIEGTQAKDPPTDTRGTQAKDPPTDTRGMQTEGETLDAWDLEIQTLAAALRAEREAVRDLRESRDRVSLRYLDAADRLDQIRDIVSG